MFYAPSRQAPHVEIIMPFDSEDIRNRIVAIEIRDILGSLWIYFWSGNHCAF
jgi:predicted metalloenzyme YecM